MVCEKCLSRCKVATDAVQAEVGFWSETLPCRRICSNESLDLVNVVGLVKGGSEVVSALAMFGLPRLIAFPYPYTVLRQFIGGIEIFVLETLCALMTEGSEWRASTVRSKAGEEGCVKHKLLLNLKGPHAGMFDDRWLRSTACIVHKSGDHPCHAPCHAPS